MKKIYLTLLVALTVLTLKASPDIYAPDLVSPANNATGIFPDVTLDWSAVAGQLGLFYEVQLSTTEDFANPAVFTTDLTSYKMSLLLFAQDYFWRVRAIDNSGTSEWSAVRKFTVVNTVTIRRPTNGSTGAFPNVSIIWTDITGVQFVDYQLDTTANFNSPLMTLTTVVNKPGSSQTNAANLYFGLKYFLRMRGHHAADTSAWTEPWNFTVTNTLTLKEPAASEAGLSPDIEFVWTKVDGLSKYQLHISTDPSMTQYESYNVAPNLTKFKPDTLLFGTTYYWMMAGMHATDTLFSAIRSFSTVDKVTLTFPENNATNVELQPTLTWEEMTGLVSFQLDIAKSSDFTGKFTYLINSGGTNEFKVPIHVLDSASVYYWRVRAISSRDTSDYSDAWSFRSVTLGKEDNMISGSGLSVYPSPASTKVSVKVKNTFNGYATVEIYDLLGTKRMTSNAYLNNGYVKDLPIGSLPNGVYMISIIANDQRSTAKLIIRK